MDEMHSKVLSGVKAVFFDLDDTLCGYWDASKAGLRTAFERHGPRDVPVERMVQAWAKAFRAFSPTLKQTGWYDTYLKVGEPTRTEQMRLALKEVDIVDEEMALRLSEAYAEDRNANLKLFPESIEVLHRLHEKYSLGLITNGPADIQRQEIHTLGIEHFFDFVMIEGEMGIGKPHFEVLRRAQESVSANPNEILFVGNSYGHDIRPSIEVGWHTVWVRRPSDVAPSADGVASEPEQKPDGAPSPTAIISDLRELYPLLGIN